VNDERDYYKRDIGGSMKRKSDIEVSFEHWSFCISEETLTRCGSRYYGPSEVRSDLLNSLTKDAKQECSENLIFSRSQLICANEAFPESAVADPIADLEIYDEWKNGIRQFPYPGRYERLGITEQHHKINSPSSTGVIGEMMAGLFAQVGIGAWIQIRNIRRWPDFIFWGSNDRFAFVESKAFVGEPVVGPGISGRATGPLLGEFLLDSVQELNADPSVSVWGAFTQVVEIRPMRLLVTFLNVNVPDEVMLRRQSQKIPEAVARGFSKRAIEAAVPDLDPNFVYLFEKRRGYRKQEGKQAEDSLHQLAIKQLDNILADAGPLAKKQSSREYMYSIIKEEIRKVTLKEDSLKEGRRFYDAKERASKGEWTDIREVGGESIYMKDLSESERSKFSNDWTPQWNIANQPWSDSTQTKWRCSGAGRPPMIGPPVS
jgi:hypothetical protein